MGEDGEEELSVFKMQSPKSVQSHPNWPLRLAMQLPLCQSSAGLQAAAKYQPAPRPKGMQDRDEAGDCSGFLGHRHDPPSPLLTSRDLQSCGPEV